MVVYCFQVQLPPHLWPPRSHPKGILGSSDVQGTMATGLVEESTQRLTDQLVPEYYPRPRHLQKLILRCNPLPLKYIFLTLQP
uniref:Uncharacterized protein n=1 Tax=Pyxicephalus adspersus TaxID=30357 RepID=A0AAV3AMY6_PYXAD|nr:TPA: hypothetical protein GDO54_011827 [Pyxicephalus adspersus]